MKAEYAHEIERKTEGNTIIKSNSDLKITNKVYPGFKYNNICVYFHRFTANIINIQPKHYHLEYV